MDSYGYAALVHVYSSMMAFKGLTQNKQLLTNVFFIVFFFFDNIKHFEDPMKISDFGYIANTCLLVFS